MKILLAVVLLLPVVALAQADQLVFFTGDQATPDVTPYMFTTAPYQQVEIHMGIYGPSLSCFRGFETDVVVEGSLLAPTWFFPACGMIPECPQFPLQLGFIDCDPIGFGAVYYLGTLTAIIPTPADIVRFYLGPVPGSITFPDSPGYGGDIPEVFVPLTTVHGTNWDRPAFSINEVVVANEDETWGSVKAMFR